MKNKNAKHMWIYASILCVIALALILITTIAQWKLVPESGNLQLLDTFTQNSTQRIDQLTQENVNLKTELNQAQSDLLQTSELYNALLAENDTLKSDKAFADASNQKLYTLLNAYLANDKDTVGKLLKDFSKEELDAILPDFYDKANNL